jgi:nitrite reductase/ring-hydroxylating ferredoxin subunit
VSIVVLFLEIWTAVAIPRRRSMFSTEATSLVGGRKVHRVANRPRPQIELCGIADVAEGGTLKVQTDDKTLAVFNVKGTFFVTDDHCTHGPGSLSQGWLEGYEIVCEFHQGRFDVRTGEVTEPPCMIPVRSYKVAVVGDRVTIEI